MEAGREKDKEPEQEMEIEKEKEEPIFTKPTEPPPRRRKNSIDREKEQMYEDLETSLASMDSMENLLDIGIKRNEEPHRTSSPRKFRARRNTETTSERNQEAGNSSLNQKKPAPDQQSAEEYDPKAPQLSEDEKEQGRSLIKKGFWTMEDTPQDSPGSGKDPPPIKKTPRCSRPSRSQIPISTKRQGSPKTKEGN